mgnify:CR=1 FL=1
MLAINGLPLSVKLWTHIQINHCLIVICLMSSSKHWLYSSSRIGQIPVYLACLCCNLLSNFSWRSSTSCLVAGVAETDWILNGTRCTRVVAFQWYIILEVGWSWGCPLCRCWLDFEDLVWHPEWGTRYFDLFLAWAGDKNGVGVLDKTLRLIEVGGPCGGHM